ncbi:hypothetical protein BDP81DRAFT_423753, partial [Colletotrichum phormii]
MAIYSSKSWELRYQMDTRRGAEVSATAGVPIAAAAGVTMKLDAGLAFETSVSNHWEFESLDTSIIQPTLAFVEESISTAEVCDYLDGQACYKTSTMFMITGIACVRTVHSEVPLGIAETGLQGGFSKDKALVSSAKRTTDFVWAVRLAKISKGLLDWKWSWETLSRGATFGRTTDDAEVGGQIAKALRDEGLEVCPCPITVNDDVFILGSDGGPTSD